MPVNLSITATRLIAVMLSLTSVFLMVGSGNQYAETRSLLSTAALVRVQADWERYQLPGGEVSVQMPAVPAMSSYKVRPDPQAKSRLMHLIGAYSQGVVYAIYIFERKQSLEDFIASFGHVSAEPAKRDLTVSGVRGKEYVRERDTRKGTARYFITDRRIYVFETQGSILGNPDVGIPRFMDSINFVRPVTGHVIVDGPGEPADAEVKGVGNGTETQIFKSKELSPKAVVVIKPEPNYTDRARDKQVIGTVMLSCVFSSTGTVDNLQVTAGLPGGLTERAMTAARQIKFIPAIKDGHFVSMYIRLEYNFNLY